MHTCAIIYPAKWDSLPVPHFLLFLITSPFLFSPQILNVSLFPLPRLLPLPLHVYLWCCSLWLSLPAADERVDWLEVVSGVRSGGLAPSRPVSLCLSSLQSSRQDETAPPRFAHRSRGPTSAVAHQDPRTHPLFHYGGARRQREKWDWGGKRGQGVKRVRQRERQKKGS